MALVLKDRVKETTTTTGTGTITLAGAVVGYQTFSVIGNTNTTYYVIEDANNAWEVGIGTYTLSGTTLSRDTILDNSAGNTSAITLSSGTHTVFCGYPAGKSVVTESPTLVTPALGTPSALVATNATGTAASLTAGTATLATLATSVTVTANNGTNETVYPLFVDGATGTQGTETDTGLTYNPDSGLLTSTLFAGALTGNVTGNASGSSGSCTGNSATVTNGVYTSNNLSVMAATTSAQLAGVISDETGSGALVFATSPTLVTPVLGTPASGTLTNCTFPTLNQSTSGTAAIATTVTVADESADATCFPLFVTAATGNVGPKSGTNLTFASDTGILTATGFAGPLTGNVTGNASGTAATVTGGTQAAITSAANLVTIGTVTSGTLSTGTVLAGVTVTMGSDAEGDIYYRNSGGVLTRLAASTDGHVLTATGAGSAPAWEAATGGTPTVITVADESTDTTCFPLFVTAATGDLGPKSGSNLTFNSNTGVLTATGFAGPITGNVTGNASGTAATVTTAAQSAITSVGTLTSVVVADGGNIGSASDTDAISIASTGAVTFSKATKPALKSNSDASTVTFDVNEANVHTVTLGANRVFAISNETAGQKFMIRILQDGTGSRTVTWFSTIKWAGGSAPTLTTTANKADVVGFLVTGADTYDGFVIGQNI